MILTHLYTLMLAVNCEAAQRKLIVVVILNCLPLHTQLKSISTGGGPFDNLTFSEMHKNIGLFFSFFSSILLLL